MRGLFCKCTAKNNEEYRKVVKRRMGLMALLAIIGITVAVTASLAFHWEASAISDHALGIYSGVGSGLTGSALFFLICDFFLLKNEEKLKQQRLENTDERLATVRDSALKPALCGLLIVLFAGCLIGSIFYPVLIYVLAVTAWTFLIIYLIAYHYYEKKM